MIFKSHIEFLDQGMIKSCAQILWARCCFWVTALITVFYWRRSRIYQGLHVKEMSLSMGNMSSDGKAQLVE